jgi:hypothetical protein
MVEKVKQSLNLEQTAEIQRAKKQFWLKRRN